MWSQSLRPSSDQRVHDGLEISFATEMSVKISGDDPALQALVLQHKRPCGFQGAFATNCATNASAGFFTLGIYDYCPYGFFLVFDISNCIVKSSAARYFKWLHVQFNAVKPYTRFGRRGKKKGSATDLLSWRVGGKCTNITSSRLEERKSVMTHTTP
ncbi:hypothetical protein PoB_001644200 [Plakobranchus ocellatus]|uniref:Uncharacterized protein n=1 Tax=Plakobranchus ocellatus TaxID=259542 RepID=A0AAV3Z5Z0_9GAST|nr:hypothetical protein PoB_001644200 [Plakobranchus ocellatus]